jgi:uncharacterized NAD(P)/FAD-binding protein YdhS
MACGVAFASRHRSYLLNVPAGRMSASSADPLEFLCFAQRTRPDATAADFLPRHLYGDYLEASLLSAAQAAPSQVRLERMRGHVIAIERARRTSAARLPGGATIAADTVVLRSAIRAPSRSGSEQLPNERYVAVPGRCNPHSRRRVRLIIGTGSPWPTLRSPGVSQPRARPRFCHLAPWLLHRAAGLAQAEWSARPTLRERLAVTAPPVRAVRSLAEDIELRGGDWRGVRAGRNLIPLWRRLSMRERQRFLQHVRGCWDLIATGCEPTWSALNELCRADPSACPRRTYPA